MYRIWSPYCLIRKAIEKESMMLNYIYIYIYIYPKLLEEIDMTKKKKENKKKRVHSVKLEKI